MMSHSDYMCRARAGRLKLAEKLTIPMEATVQTDLHGGAQSVGRALSIECNTRDSLNIYDLHTIMQTAATASPRV